MHTYGAAMVRAVPIGLLTACTDEVPTLRCIIRVRSLYCGYYAVVCVVCDPSLSHNTFGFVTYLSVVSYGGTIRSSASLSRG